MAARFRQGEWLPLLVLCTNASGAAVNPDSAPRYRILSSSSVFVTSGRLYPADLDVTGLFMADQFIDELFQLGNHTVHITWVAGAHHGSRVQVFTVIDGGNGSGQTVAMTSYQRQPNSFLVTQRDSGRIYKGRNPLP